MTIAQREGSNMKKILTLLFSAFLLWILTPGFSPAAVALTRGADGKYSKPSTATAQADPAPARTQDMSPEELELMRKFGPNREKSPTPSPAPTQESPSPTATPTPTPAPLPPAAPAPCRSRQQLHMLHRHRRRPRTPHRTHPQRTLAHQKMGGIQKTQLLSRHFRSAQSFHIPELPCGGRNGIVEGYSNSKE
jgi:hypothetical protein